MRTKNFGCDLPEIIPMGNSTCSNCDMARDRPSVANDMLKVISDSPTAVNKAEVP